MAIVFTPKGLDPAVAFTIGGTASAPDDGVAGPFANLSISKEIRRQDSLVLGAMWTISITGTALITETASHLVKGQRQGELFDLQKELLFKQAISTQGTLDIDAYGGTSELLFNNATLTSVETPDQDESSMGTQNQPYSFTFVSYDGDGTLSPEVGRGTAIKWIESFDESWDVSLQDGTYSGTTVEVDGVEDADTELNYHTYTISHSISAQAVLGSQDSTANMSYVKAKAFVEERLIDNPFADVDRTDERGTVVVLDMPASYIAYNHVRQRQQSIAAGSYSVTDTWVASKYPATYTIDYSFNGDSTAEFNTVDITLSAQGFSTKHPETSSTQDKYTNALVNWDTVKIAAQTGATAFYTAVGGTGTLRTAVLLSSSESHNETDGSLQYSCTLDDATVSYGPEALSESLNITYDNVDAGNNIVAIIPVLAKADGPVIQDMKTTNEKAVSISLDLQMNKDNRTERPDELQVDDNGNISGNIDFDEATAKGKATRVVETYKPTGSQVYRRSRSESWNPYNGQYNLSMEYVYVVGSLPLAVT
jgi:hypothetical protein